MKILKLFILIALVLCVSTTVFAETAVIGSIWKQENTTALPADDVTEIDLSNKTVVFTGVSTVGLDIVGVGQVVQVVSKHFGEVVTGSNTMPHGDVKSIITDGDTYMTLGPINCVFPNSKIFIQCEALLSNTRAGYNMVSALYGSFYNQTALVTTSEVESIANGRTSIALTNYTSACLSGSPTYTFNAGDSAVSTTTFNGTLSSRVYAGSANSSCTAWEVKQ